MVAHCHVTQVFLEEHNTYKIIFTNWGEDDLDLSELFSSLGAAACVTTISPLVVLPNEVLLDARMRSSL